MQALRERGHEREQHARFLGCPACHNLHGQLGGGRGLGAAAATSSKLRCGRASHAFASDETPRCAAGSIRNAASSTSKAAAAERCRPPRRASAPARIARQPGTRDGPAKSGRSASATCAKGRPVAESSLLQDGHLECGRSVARERDTRRSGTRPPASGSPPARRPEAPPSPAPRPARERGRVGRDRKRERRRGASGSLAPSRSSSRAAAETRGAVESCEPRAIGSARASAAGSSAAARR